MSLLLKLYYRLKEDHQLRNSQVSVLYYARKSSVALILIVSLFLGVLNNYVYCAILNMFSSATIVSSARNDLLRLKCI